MGVGKTFYGKLLANAINYNFLDTDQIIEKKEDLSIQEIFKLKGEEYFRALEKEVIHEILPKNNCVISCGGGLPMIDGLFDILKANGIVIGLIASKENILKRTNSSKRPLLDVSKPDEVIHKLLIKREPIYLKSDICINTDNTPSSVEKLLLDSYNNYINGF